MNAEQRVALNTDLRVMECAEERIRTANALRDLRAVAQVLPHVAACDVQLDEIYAWVPMSCEVEHVIDAVRQVCQAAQDDLYHIQARAMEDLSSLPHDAYKVIARLLVDE